MKLIRLSDIVFLDIEASGLGDGCYPIEIGVVHAAGLTGWSALIRPPKVWRDGGVWDCLAADIHGIGQTQLDTEGWDVMDVARALNETLDGKAVFSDAPEFDRHWIAMLFDETDMEPAFHLRSATMLINRAPALVAVDAPVPVAAAEPPPPSRHRARDDALALARAFWTRLTASEPATSR
jgi:hypothetical protein